MAEHMMTFALRVCAPDIFAGVTSWSSDHKRAAQNQLMVVLAASLLLIAWLNAGGHMYAHSRIPITFGSPAMPWLQVAVGSQRNVDFPAIDVWSIPGGQNPHVRYSLAA